MDSAGFDVSRWDHWLLVVSFVGVASYGLRLSWQWRVERYQSRVKHFRARIVRRYRRKTRRFSSRDATQRRLVRQLATQIRARQQNHHAP